MTPRHSRRSSLLSSLRSSGLSARTFSLGWRTLRSSLLETNGLLFFVPGIPVQQGSKVYGVTRDGRPYGREAAGAKLHKWRNAMRDAAYSEMVHLGRAGPMIPSGSPVWVEALYYYAPLKSNPSAARNVSAAGLDKSLRRSRGSLSGLVYDDDERVRLRNTWKGCAKVDQEPGVWVLVAEL